MAAPGDTRRERILAAALNLLAEQGYEGMSLQRLADRVGLHKSSLFHHFDCKEDLARAVYTGVGERLRKVVEPYLDADPPSLERALELSDALVDHFAAEPAAARLLLRSMVAEPGSALPAVPQPSEESDPTHRLVVRVGEWLDRARRAGAVRDLRVRQALLNVLALVLYYPAVAHDLGRDVLAGDPHDARALASRKRELRAALRGLLAPR